MIISISGSSGFIGTALIQQVARKGWTAAGISRRAFSLPEKEFIEKYIEPSDAVINLAGYPIIRRWTEASKKEMSDSRILTTRKIADAIRRAGRKPAVLISASAIGIYDDEHEHTEESTDFGTGFLAELCSGWEKEALLAAGMTRVVIFRTGMVFGTGGGALKKMELPFKMGLGAKIGNGKQSLSWIHLDDLVSAYLFAVEKEQVSGIVNAVAPEPTSNSYFTKTFGKVLTQPAFLKIPEFAVRMLYGDGASVLTGGQRVLPAKLLKNGFPFRYPTVEKALMHLYK